MNETSTRRRQRPLPPTIQALIERQHQRFEAREDLIKACARYAEASTTSLLQAVKGHHDGRTKEAKALGREVRESLRQFETAARRWVRLLDEEGSRE